MAAEMVVVATHTHRKPESQTPGPAGDHTGHLFKEKYFPHLCMEKISTGSRAPTGREGD